MGCTGRQMGGKRMIADLLPVLEIVVVLVAVFLLLRRVNDDQPSWWARNVIDDDPNPTYSQLDRMDGLHNDKDNR